MASSEVGISSEQETDTAEETEAMMNSSEARSPIPMSEDSNSTHNDAEETESAMSTDRDNCSTAPQTPTKTDQSGDSVPQTHKTPNRDLPFRAGITWQKGERLEAMDYLNKWYPAKIMAVDEEEKSVLIHFEGWNQRYDEWTSMESEGLRPLTRHSGRKEKQKKHGQVVHRVGDKVLAKWTDCKMYPAKVSSVNSNGSLEVVFYDGFQKTVQPINVKPFSERHQLQKMVPDKMAPAEIKKHRKSEDGRRSTVGRPRSSSKEGKEKGPVGRPRHKLIVAGSFLAKRERSRSMPGFGREPRSKDKPEVKKKFNFAPAKTVVVHPKKEKVAESETKKRGKKRAFSLPSDKGSSPVVRGDHPTTPTSAPAVPAKRARSTEKDKSGGLAPKEFVIQPDHNLFKCMFPGCSKSFRKENLLDYHIKYYHVEASQTPQPAAYRVKRRKTSSICSTDSDISVSSKGKTTPGEGSAGKRKRHVSSASDIQILKEEPTEEVKKEPASEGPEMMTTESADHSTNLSASEEKPTVSSDPQTSMVVPPLPQSGTSVAMPTADVKRQSVETGAAAEDTSLLETEDEGGDEVVNCMCGYNEENGLMIQCDVCMCWQHANCFNIKCDALPKKYTCFVCENPPGIRDSRRFSYDQDWFKNGQLRSFNFVNTKQSEADGETIRATHGLVGDVLNIKSVLYSLKQQIKVAGNENHPEMRTWRKVCEERRRRQQSIVTQIKKETPAEETIPIATVSTATVATGDLPEETASLGIPANLEAQEDEPVVRFSLGPEELEKEENVMKDDEKLLKEESPLSKSMACQASFDLSSSSLDRSDEKSFDASMADNDSDTSTMTASESSYSYVSSFPSGPSATSFPSDENILSGGDGVMEDVGGKQEGRKVKEEDVPGPCREIDESILTDDAERSMLLHIISVQSELNDRLDLVEEQIAALERAESGQAPDKKTVLNDVPALKRSLHTLIRDLGKVNAMASYH